MTRKPKPSGKAVRAVRAWACVDTDGRPDLNLIYESRDAARYDQGCLSKSDRLDGLPVLVIPARGRTVHQVAYDVGRNAGLRDAIGRINSMAWECDERGNHGGVRALIFVKQELRKLLAKGT